MKNVLYGAIIGDYVGSIYEFRNSKTKDFPFFSEYCRITDDSCMTIALADALLKWKEQGGNLSEIAINSMRHFGIKHRTMGYGHQFKDWLNNPEAEAYNSWGNGAAMRISAVSWIANSINEVKQLSYSVTSVTHNHIEGIKGAEVTAICVFLAKTGATKEEIYEYVHKNYYETEMTVKELQETYKWHSSCQGTVPQAIQCFIESNSYEDAIRNAISIGGDSDTIGAITGAIAGAFYGIPQEFVNTVKEHIPEDLLAVVDKFDKLIETSYIK